MITKRIKELESAKARLARLEKTLTEELRSELASLPKTYGFASVREFIAAVVRAGSPSRGGRKAARKPARKTRKGAAAGAKRRRRAVITDATRAEVKKLSEAGKTGLEIAKSLKISLPSVQNIRKALGLVKSRK